MLNYNNVDSDFDGSVAFQDLLGVNAPNVIFQPGGIAREHTGASRNQDIIIKGFTHIHRTFLKMIIITLMDLKTTWEVPIPSIPSTAGLKSSSVASKRSLK